MLHFAARTAPAAGGGMKIKSPKDFWAGLMFIGTGLFFMFWAMTHYQMGTAVRMGPAYFPTLLGGLLVVLGAIVLFQAFVVRAAGDSAVLKLPFNIIDLVIAIGIYVVVIYLFNVTKVPNGADWGMVIATAIVCVLTMKFRPGARGLVLISASCVAYGYLMKPAGLIGATAALVFVSAYGGHEFKWKEVTILFLILIVFSILVFVKGLTLPFPICPSFMDSCPIR